MARLSADVTDVRNDAKPTLCQGLASLLMPAFLTSDLADSLVRLL